MTDIITNSSSVTFIYPLNDAVASTKLFLKKMMLLMGINGNVEEMFDIEIQVKDSWYWYALYYTSLGESFLKSKNINQNDFYSVDEKTLNKLVEEFKQAFLSGDITFDEWEYGSSRRFLDIIIKNKNGEIVNLNEQIMDIYNIDYIDSD